MQLRAAKFTPTETDGPCRPESMSYTIVRQWAAGQSLLSYTIVFYRMDRHLFKDISFDLLGLFCM